MAEDTKGKRLSPAGEGNRVALATPPEGAPEAAGGSGADVVEREDALQRRARDLAALNDLAVELAEADNLASVFRISSDLLRRMSGAAAVVIATYDSEAGELGVRHVSAGRALLGKIKKAAGGAVDAIRSPVDKSIEDAMLSAPRVKSFEGVRESAAGRLPEGTAAALEEAVGPGSVYTVALRQGNELVGEVAVFMAGSKPPYPADVVENFANIVAGAVRRKRVEEELQERERGYKQLTEGLTDVVVRISASSRIEYISPAIRSLGGYEPEEMVGRPVGEFFIEEDELAGTMAAIGRVFRENVNEKVEFLFRAKDRKPVYVEVTGQPVVEGDEVVGILSVMRDISERKRVEDALRCRAEDLRAINELALELADVASVHQVYKIAGDRLLALTDARAAIVASFDDDAGELTVEAIAGGDGILSKPIEKVVPFIEGSKIPIDADMRGNMMSSRVRSFDGLHGLTMGVIPKPVAAAVEKTLGSGLIHAIALRSGGEVLGGISLLMPKGAPPYSFEVLENFGNVVAAALRRKQVEVALRESESKLGAMLRSIGDHMSMIDGDLNILWANETARRTFGEDLIGKKCYAVYHGRSKPCRPYPCITLQAFADGKSHEHITQVTDKDGCGHFFHCTANVALRSEEGDPTAVIELSRDITENKKNEEELRRARETLEERIKERTAELTRALAELAKSEETYRSLVRMSPDGVAFIDVDGKVTHASLQTARIHGFDDPEEVVGRNGFELVAPDERDRAAAFLQRGLEEGGVNNFELLMMKKDGSLFHAETSAALLRDGEGRPSGFIVTTRDVTERKRADDELRRTLAQNQAILAAVPDLMFTIDKEGTYVDFKQTDAAMLALPPEEIIGKNIRDTGLSPDAEKVVMSRLADALRTGAVTTAEYELPAPRGPGVYEARFAKISDDEVLSVVRDITERKKAEVALRQARDELEARVRERTAALEQSNEELRSFTYLVSHDLRAPLVNLQGFAAELRESLESVRNATKAAVPHLDAENRKELATALGQDVPEALSFIETSAKRMDGYINGVLKLSRLGRRELEFETLDMTALVDETLKTLHHQLEARGAKARVAALPEVPADRTAMEQIVGNLLANAVCYLQPGRPGEIEVTGERADGVVAVHVRDNGRGIAPNDLKKVFEPFARVGEPSTPGEGMGLAYVQTLVRRHGGRIWCESEPGVGTTFTFTIPEPRTEGGGYA